MICKKQWWRHQWKYFPRYWPFVRGIHRSPVNSPHKVQWRRALNVSLIYTWINDWVNNCEAGDLRRYRAHYDVIVMHIKHSNTWIMCNNCQAKRVIYNYTDITLKPKIPLHAVYHLYDYNIIPIRILWLGHAKHTTEVFRCDGDSW